MFRLEGKGRLRRIDNCENLIQMERANQLGKLVWDVSYSFKTAKKIHVHSEEWILNCQERFGLDDIPSYALDPPAELVPWLEAEGIASWLNEAGTTIISLQMKERARTESSESIEEDGSDEDAFDYTWMHRFFDDTW